MSENYKLNRDGTLLVKKDGKDALDSDLWEEYRLSEDGNFFVNRQGDVLDAKTKERIEPTVLNIGDTKRLIVSSRSNGVLTRKYIHKLVACLFVPNINGGTYVRIKDGKYTNVSYTNLEWETARDKVNAALKKRIRNCERCGTMIKNMLNDELCSECKADIIRERIRESKRLKRVESFDDIDERRVESEKNKEILKELKTGKPVSKIAEEMKCSRANIYSCIKRMREASDMLYEFR